jgi:hypothetical protein
MSTQRDHAALEKRRGKAARLFARDTGASKVARLLGVRRRPAHAWLQRWHAGGLPALDSKGPAGPMARLVLSQRAAETAALL